MIYAKYRVHIGAVLFCVLWGAAIAPVQAQENTNYPLSTPQTGSGIESPIPDILRQSLPASAKDRQDTGQTTIADSLPAVMLDMYEYWVADTAESVSFRLHVRNNTDSLVILDRVEPSCGCILTTVQKSLARKGKDAEVYIALMTSRMNDVQPYTVDVYTSANPNTPLRLYICKKPLTQPDHAQ